MFISCFEQTAHKTSRGNDRKQLPEFGAAAKLWVGHISQQQGDTLHACNDVPCTRIHAIVWILAEIHGARTREVQ